MPEVLLCTTDQVPGHRVVAVFGLVRGLTVRSRSMFGDMVAGVESAFGGRQSVMIELCEEARSEATRLLMDRAAKEEACLECGKPIPASAKECPHCGWTWLQSLDVQDQRASGR